MTEANHENKLSPFFNTVEKLLLHLNDPVWDTWHIETFTGLVKIFDERADRVEKIAKDLAAADVLLEKGLGPNFKPTDTSQIDAAAASFRDVADALRKRLAQPAPDRDGLWRGTPVHLINRAIPRPGDTWH